MGLTTLSTIIAIRAGARWLDSDQIANEARKNGYMKLFVYKWVSLTLYSE